MSDTQPSTPTPPSLQPNQTQQSQNQTQPPNQSVDPITRSFTKNLLAIIFLVSFFALAIFLGFVLKGYLQA